MIVKFKGRLLGLNESKGKAYALFNDVDMGSQFKMTFPGMSKKDMKIDGLYDLSVEVRPGYYNGNMYLTVVDIKSTSENDGKGDNK